MRRPAAVALALLALAGCGDQSSPAQEALEDAADATTRVRQGDLRLRVAATSGQGEAAPVGFEVEGPFSLSLAEDRLPEVRFTYTELLGATTEQALFVSDGTTASVTRRGRRRTFDDDEVAHLRGRAEPGRGGLPRLAVDEWARNPRLASTAPEDGVAVRRVVAEVDAAEALQDVVELAAAVGADPQEAPRLEGDDADRLRALVRSSRLEVLVGRDDDVLRRLRLTVRFAGDRRDELTRLLGRLAAVRLSVEVDLRPGGQPSP